MNEIVEIYKTLEGLGVSRIVLDVIAMFGVFFLWSTKWEPWFNKIKYRMKLTNQAATDQQIIKELLDAKDAIICDRIAIYEFHNSNHNLLNKSFMKHSCTYEVCRLGVQSYDLGRTNLPNGAYPEVVNCINNKSSIAIRDVDKDTTCSELLKDYLVKGGIKSYIMLPIIELGVTCGFLCVQFTREVRFTDEEFPQVINQCYVLLGRIGKKVCTGK